MALDPRLSDPFRTNPARMAAQGVPSTPASATEWPHAVTEPKATLRPVDPRTGMYRMPGATPPPVGATPPPVGATPPSPGAAPTAARTGVGAVGVVGKTAYGLGRVGAVAAGAAPALLGADAISHFNDYKINDPGVDSSTAGTLRYLGEGNFKQAGASLSKGALEAGMDLGSFATNLADYAVPGKAPVSTAYDKMLRDKFGDQLVAHPSVGRSVDQTPETLRTPPTVTSGPPLTDTQKQLAITDTARARQEAGMAPANSFQESALAYKPEQPSTINFQKGNSFSVVPAGSHVSQYGFVSADPLTKEQQAGVDARIKAQGGGQDEYGNYLTPQAMAVRQERLRGGGGPQISEEDRTRIAAAHAAIAYNDDQQRKIDERNASSALSDAMKKQPGESRADYNARLDFLSSTRGQDFDERSSLRTDGTQRRGQDITERTTLRGQDMDLQGRLLPKQMEMQYAAQQRGLRAEAFKQAGGDYSRMADLLASQGLDPSSALGAAADRQAYGTKSEEQSRGMFKSAFDTPTGKDGAVVARPDLEASAYARLMEMSGGKFNQLPKEQQDLLRTSAIAEVRELGQANEKRGGGLWEAVGIDNPPPEFSNLPSAAERQSAMLRQADFMEWASPFNEIEKGDWVETLRDGRQYRTGPLSESRIKERLQQGAQLK